MATRGLRACGCEFYGAGYSVETSRGDAAAATWIFRGDEVRRRGNEAEIDASQRRDKTFYESSTVSANPSRCDA